LAWSEVGSHLKLCYILHSSQLCCYEDSTVTIILSRPILLILIPILNTFIRHKRQSQNNNIDRNTKQDAQLSQRDRAAGCVIVLAKSRRLELGDNILQAL